MARTRFVTDPVHSIRGQLETAGYTVSPSPQRYKRLISRDGVPIGHFAAEEACRLLDPQYDVHPAARPAF